MSDELSMIVADIGGTNARFACVTAEGVPYAIHKLRCADYVGLAEALLHYQQLSACKRPAQVCVAVAGPVGRDEVKLTNNHWRFSVRELTQRLQLQRLLVINDFAALSAALVHLRAEDLLPVIPGAAEPLGNRALLGPGTGLGAAGLVWSGTQWVVVSGEGGYVSLPLRTDRDVDVWRLIRERYGRVSAERVLCGQGLVELYQALSVLERRVDAGLSPADIVQAALTGSDVICQESLQMFCAFLGDVAGNLALSFGAVGGVYLGGGIPPRIREFLLQSDFKARYLDRGRAGDYIQRMPVAMIVADTPALWGCADVLLRAV